MSPMSVHLLRSRPRSRRWVVVVSSILGWLLLYQLLAQFRVHSNSSSHISSPVTLSVENTVKHGEGLKNIGHAVDEIALTSEPSSSQVVESVPISPKLQCDDTLWTSMQDVLVVMKTGATEPRDKVEAQLRTSLRCLPHFAVFSDLEEQIHAGDNISIQTHDVLQSVSSNTKETNPDFGLYQRLRQSGRAGLLSADYNSDASGPFGKPNNPGWNLDKWKFLPMIDASLKLHPNAKWFVFLEADTYIFWSNLRYWLSQFDAAQPYYLGNQMQIGDVVFGHGGSGFILSQPAMQSASEALQDPERVARWESFTASHWAGDCVLGKFLTEEVNVGLQWSYPMLQGDAFWEADLFGEAMGKDRWCFPAVSYHHITTQELEILYKFDQDWSTKHPNLPILQRDIFNDLIYPGLLDSPSDDWDNLSGDIVDLGDSAPRSQVRSSLSDKGQNYHDNKKRHASPSTTGSPISPSTYSPSQAACHMACYNEPECLQYTVDKATDKCRISKVAMRGVSRPGMRSGWMPNRIQNIVQHRFVTESADGQKQSICKQGVHWMLP